MSFLEQRYFDAFWQVLLATREVSAAKGLREWVAPSENAGLTDESERHIFASPKNSKQFILPYQLSVANRLATHYLDCPTFSFGPCYRNDVGSKTHKSKFYQATFELHSSSLDEIIEFTLAILMRVSSSLGNGSLVHRQIDLSDSEYNFVRNDNALAAVVSSAISSGNLDLLIVKNKLRGSEPLLNTLHTEHLEEAFEIYAADGTEIGDGGLRDFRIMQSIYSVTPNKQTVGGSIGIERVLHAFTELSSEDVFDKEYF